MIEDLEQLNKFLNFSYKKRRELLKSQYTKIILTFHEI